jgi:hypothetical protein
MGDDLFCLIFFKRIKLNFCLCFLRLDFGTVPTVSKLSIFKVANELVTLLQSY